MKKFLCKTALCGILGVSIFSAGAFASPNLADSKVQNYETTVCSCYVVKPCFDQSEQCYFQVQPPIVENIGSGDGVTLEQVKSEKNATTHKKRFSFINLFKRKDVKQEQAQQEQREKQTEIDSQRQEKLESVG